MKTRTAPPTLRWTVLAVLFAVVQPAGASAEDQYTLTDIGTLWASHVRAMGINNAGEVVGTLSGGFLPARNHAFVYSRGELHDLHAAVVKARNCMMNMRTAGSYITDQGDVVGLVVCSGAELRRGEANSWFLYHNGSAIVGTGSIGGSSRPQEFPVSRSGEIHIIGVDEDGMVHEVGALAGATGSPTGMNAAGEVIGVSTSTGPQRAWTWQNGVLRELGTFGESGSRPFAINAAGDIVGAVIKSAGRPRAFLYRDGSFRDLGTLGGEGSIARGINAKGQIVGLSDSEPVSAGAPDAEVRAFIYEDGKMKDLTRHLTGPAAQFVTLHEATDINDSGMITANGTDRRLPGVRAFVLTPVPENP